MKWSKLVWKYVQLPALRFFKNTTARRILWWVLFFALSFGVLATNFLPDQVEMKAGEVAKKDVFYNGGNLTYTSEIKTEEARNHAAQEVEQVFRLEPRILTELESETSSLFKNILNTKNDENLEDRTARIEKLKTLLPEKLTQASLGALIDADEQTLSSLEAELKGIIRARMQSGVVQEQLEGTKTDMSNDVAALDLRQSYKDFLQVVIDQMELQPNKIYDPVTTAQAVEEKLAQVKPVQITIKPGEKIVEKGTVVSLEQIEALQFMGLQRKTTPFLTFLGLFGFVAMVYIMIFLYLQGYKPTFLKQESGIVLLGLLINVSLIIAKIVTVIQISDRPEYAAQLGYLIPMAGCSMLLAILTDAPLALFGTVILALFTGVITNGQLAYATVALVGGLVGVYQVSRLSQRAQLVRASIYIALVNTAAIIVMGLMWNQPMAVIGLGAIMGMVNGVLASVLTIGTLPFLESAFGITTSVKLLELSNSNHPLLKKLMLEAPGTYHHSILVGNLAEAAADAIGADNLLVRVASYFHDIGKVKRPYYFIENQLPADNPHDKIAPTLSTLIITSHVKDGVELLKEYRFPKAIIDIIEQHHGTSLVSFFYHKAKEEGEKPETVLESDFRYQGPKPQTREAAIIVLADSVQAAVHVLEKPTKGHLEAKVREIIRQKLDDGQLSECDLNFKDLDIIAQTFVRVLSGMFHHRIEYPNQVPKEMERGKAKNGNSHKESAEQDTGKPGNGKTAGKSSGGGSASS